MSHCKASTIIMLALQLPSLQHTMQYIKKNCVCSFQISFTINERTTYLTLLYSEWQKLCYVTLCAINLKDCSVT